MVAFGFDRHRGAEELGHLAGRGARAQRRAQVDVLVAEEAQAQAAVGRQPDPIAAVAVVVGERADHADRAGAPAKAK